ncbi:MAG: DUF3261 domain-containing protein [Treponema sp.]|nr:DUF3261 domain-containing protein [Treponema sp.]
MTKKAYFTLMPPEYIAESIPDMVIMNAAFQSQNVSLPVCVNADKTALYFTFLNEFGLSLAELLYTGIAIEFDSKMQALMGMIPPEYIIADFQYCYYDISSIASQLARQKIKVTVERKDNGMSEIRRFYNGMHKNAPCIIEITKTVDAVSHKRTVCFINKVFQYTYTLEEVL